MIVSSAPHNITIDTPVTYTITLAEHEIIHVMGTIGVQQKLQCINFLRNQYKELSLMEAKLICEAIWKGF